MSSRERSNPSQVRAPLSRVRRCNFHSLSRGQSTAYTGCVHEQIRGLSSLGRHAFLKRNLPSQKSLQPSCADGKRTAHYTASGSSEEKRRKEPKLHTRTRKKQAKNSHTRNTAVRSAEVTEGRVKSAIVRPVYERAAATAFCAAGEIFLPSLLKRTRTGGARLRRPTRERTRTTWAWIAHEMQ